MLAGKKGDEGRSLDTGRLVIGLGISTPGKSAPGNPAGRVTDTQHRRRSSPGYEDNRPRREGGRLSVVRDDRHRAMIVCLRDTAETAKVVVAEHLREADSI